MLYKNNRIECHRSSRNLIVLRINETLVENKIVCVNKCVLRAKLMVFSILEIVSFRDLGQNAG